MMKKLNNLQWIGLLCAAMMVVSCSTQKADWKNIQFHNTTTHYNIWWNGNESLKKGIEQLEHRVKDDYTQILPVYKIGTKEDAMSQNPQFDRAIEKSIKAIKKHSIFVNGQENVPYISKCYLMMAYATYYKHDVSNAANTCQMLMSQYSGTAIADEAAVLLARCATMEKRYQDAESMLDELVVAAAKDNFAASQKLNLYLALADCTLPQEKFKKCVQFLKQALEQHPSRDQKARIYFILGQIYQDQDKRPTASKYFEKVLKCGPDYEMEFNARLSLASCADLQHTNQAKLERLLDNMLKDRKNAEFLDQIYYAKGEMYMGMHDVTKASEAYKKSVAVSKTNPAQKARSAIRLGSIMYEKLQDYNHAQLYYDTAISIINRDYPRYENIKSRYDLLTSLVSFTRVYEANDSILAVADMPEAKRLELINHKIEELKQQEEEAKEQELLEQMTSGNKALSNTLQGDWYFYNTNTVQRGKDSFRQSWGMRTLEDYWFLSKKGLMGTNMLAMATDSMNDTTSLGIDDVSDTTSDAKKDEEGFGNPDDPHCVAYYLKSIPKTQEDRDSMQLQTAMCLLNAGYIFFDGIHNIPKALECYLRMANQYPEHEDIVQAFFMLYKIYDKQGNTPNSNYYRDMVLMGFPDSDFSNLILDEDYYKEILRRGQLINEDYNEVYALYRKRKYEDVLAAVTTAKELYSGNPMLGKFRYWEGLSYARMDNKSSAIATFQGIVNDYPETDSIVPLALAQLDYLQGEGGKYIANSGGEVDEKVEDGAVASIEKKKLSLKPNLGNGIGEGELSPEAQLFRYKDNMPHLVLILVNDKKIRATQVRSKLGNFILTYYANSGLQAQPLMFNDSTQLIYINTFNDASSAVDFSTHLTLAEGPLSEYNPEDYKVFAISKQNYTTFYNRKQVDAYLMFYNKYYKK